MKRRRWVWALIASVVFAGALWLIDRPDALDGPPKDPYGMKHDPIEDDPAVRPLVAEARRVADQRLEELRAREGRPGKPWLGDCHTHWAFMKEHLKETHGIAWRTPAEMNPKMAFD